MSPATGTPPEPGWKTNPFWGFMGLSVSLLLLAFGLVMPPVLLARCSLFGAWIFLTAAALILFNHSKKRRWLVGIVSAVMAGLCLWIGVGFKGQAHSEAGEVTTASAPKESLDPSHTQRAAQTPENAKESAPREEDATKPARTKPNSTSTAPVPSVAPPGGVAPPPTLSAAKTNAYEEVTKAAWKTEVLNKEWPQFGLRANEDKRMIAAQRAKLHITADEEQTRYSELLIVLADRVRAAQASWQSDEGSIAHAFQSAVDRMKTPPVGERYHLLTPNEEAVEKQEFERVLEIAKAFPTSREIAKGDYHPEQFAALANYLAALKRKLGDYPENTKQ